MIQSKRGDLTGLKKCPTGRATYDSLLERDYMLELEHMGGVVSWNKNHGIKIPYTLFGILPHRYFPDFLITFADGSQEIHETKGAGFLAWASTHAKRKAGIDYCNSRGMKYRFIENSRGAMFMMNNGLENTIKKRNSGSLDDL